MNVRRAAAIFFASVFVLAAMAQGRSKLPVTTARGEAADLVRKWWNAHDAAGNAGDFYDNRDRDHAPLDVKQYPQLSVVSYTEAEKAARKDYAAARIVRTNMVVFGNSSTASDVAKGGGSNSRNLYNSSAGVATLYAQYRGNHLYAYPEHRDHDSGRNGNGGYGDLFHINTPYLYTSQGSSGSEMPFMRALPLTLAAFRPEVKKRLVAEGLLMPTVQMILRRTMKNPPEAADYLTGRAHPTVFESEFVDEVAMVRAAHAVTLETIPPLAIVQVVEEDTARAGVDFFDYQTIERSADTPCAIGRVGRNLAYWRRMVLTADSSFDVNTRPLTWEWAVLRGDTNRVRIKKLNARGSIVELLVAYHERRLVEPGSAMESSRVDVGCFVHNGAFVSPPAFVSVYFLESEARGYEADGKLLDVGYGAGELKATIADWRKLFAFLASDEPAVKFLKERMTGEAWSALNAPAARYEAMRLAQEEAEKEEAAAHREVEAASKDEKRAAGERRHAAVTKANTARQALKDLLAPASAALMGFVEARQADPDFAFKNKDALAALYSTSLKGEREQFDAARSALADYGLFAAGKGLEIALTPVRTAPAPLVDRLTPVERSIMERLNAAALKSLVLPGILNVDFREHFVPPALTARKDWRDIYKYDGDGKMTGWTRFGPGQAPTEFNADGSLAAGGKVRYQVKRQAGAAPGRGVTLEWTKLN